MLTILLSAAIIVAAESAALHFISTAKIAELNSHAMRTANELVGILEEPLYILDDAQVLRIGEAALSSGFVAGLRIESAASGMIIDVPSPPGTSAIPPFDATIRRSEVPLGSVHLEFSDLEVRRTRSQLIVVTLTVILVVILANYLGMRLVVLARVSRTFEPIFEGLRAIAGGDYGTKIQLSRYSDINDLIRITNGMAGQIRSKNEALLTANQTLEGRVAARTSELEQSLDSLRLAQDRLVESEKLSALGQLSAGMAHELNTPLGAILSSGRLLSDFFERQLGELLDFHQELSAEDRQCLLVIYSAAKDSEALPDLSLSARTRAKAVRKALESEGIGRADELAELVVDLGLQDRLRQLMPAFRSPKAVEIARKAAPAVVALRLVEVMGLAGEKAASVVSALRSYLTPEEEEPLGTVDIEGEIEKVLTLMHSLLKHGVAVRRSYCGLLARGSAERLGQVWLNLLRNAAQAMNFAGEIEIRTELDGTDAKVSIIDTGPGVPEAIRDRIFEPFFTTKKSGEGIGLGLDICRQIVNAHGGSISLDSSPGRTAFIVVLPFGGKKEDDGR